MRARIVCLPGDGIGPEVMQEAVRVLTSVAIAFGHSFSFVEEKLGSAAIQAHGKALSEKTLDSCRLADGVLLGAAFSPALQYLPHHMPLQSCLHLLQSGLHLYAGLQHCSVPPAPDNVSSLRENLLDGMDMMLVWPLDDGPFDSSMEEEGQRPIDMVSSSAVQAEQVLRLAFRLARERRKYVCGTFLNDLYAVTRMWRDTAMRVSRDYPDVAVQWLEPDRCALEIVKHPPTFDVLLAGPMLQRPLSGIMAGVIGSLGLTPCVLMGDNNPFVYMPAQGEESSLAGRDMANPIGMILCAAMMLRKSLHLNSEADCVEMAVKNVMDSGWRTLDMVSGNAPRVGTQAIGKLIAEQVDTAGAVMGTFRRS